MYLHARPNPAYHGVNGKRSYIVDVALTREHSLRRDLIETYSIRAYDPCHAMDKAVDAYYPTADFTSWTCAMLGAFEAEGTVTVD